MKGIPKGYRWRMTVCPGCGLRVKITKRERLAYHRDAQGKACERAGGPL